MLLDVFFPNRCLCCQRIISVKEVVCPLCEAQIPFTHFLFDGQNVFAQMCRALFPVENAFSLLYYRDNTIAQKVIHRLKYAYREEVGIVLSGYVIECIESFPLDINLVAIVPLHPKKQQKRGYNQLKKFATSLCEYYQLPLDETLLRRNQNTKAQARRAKHERGSAKGVFSMREGRDNTHFLLIDDVFTTGNTLSSIAWELLSSGENNRVSVMVMAVKM